MDTHADETVTRRAFLERSIAVLGGLIAVVLGGSGLGYFISPAFRRRTADWLDLGRVSEIAPGTPVKVEFTVRKKDAWATTERRSSAWVLTSNRKDFIVFDPRCTHLGCPYRWDPERKQFRCPCHSAVFDVDGSVAEGPPPRPLDRYPAKVVGGRLLILPEARKAEPA